jgi:predicted nucleic acid-binding protein
MGCNRRGIEMARQTLVIDASIGVKWFSIIGEASVSQAKALLKLHAGGDINLVVPDIFFHEICNVLVYKKALTLSLIEEAIFNLYILRLSVLPASEDRLKAAVQLARNAGITEYDAFYAVAAIEKECPLVTANPRHQGHKLGCRVIPIEKWKMEG